MGGADGVKDSRVPVNFLSGVQYLEHFSNKGDFGTVGCKLKLNLFEIKCLVGMFQIGISRQVTLLLLVGLNINSI